MMKTAIFLPVLAIASLITLSPLSAQISTTEFSLPFQFRAGNTMLPAGSYQVSIDSSARFSLVTLTAADLSDAIALLPQPEAIAEGAALDATVALVFHKYGDDYFLRQVRHNGSRQILHLPETKAEKAAARQDNLRQVALIHPR